LCATFLLLVVAATRSPAALGPRYGGELRLGLPELPASLAPAPIAGIGPRVAAGLVHETLLGLGPDGQPTTGLAASWVSAAEGREWRLSIGEYARFHDDRPVLAEDAVRSLRAFLRGPGAAAAALARALEGGPAFRSRERDDLPGLAAPDPRQVVLRFTSPPPPPLAALASPAAAVTSAGGAGAGPFVPTVFVPGLRLVGTAFAGHARGRPYLDRLQVEAFPDPTALAARARAGRVDLAAGEAGVEALAASVLLVLDPRRPPFDRPAARAAVAGAIDRAALMGRLLVGGTPSTDLLPPSLLRASDAPRPAVGVARFTLSRAVTLAVSRDVPPVVSQRVLAHLAALGLRVHVVPVTPAAALNAPTELRLLAYAPEVLEPALALEELLALAPPPPAALERLEAARREADPARRLALLAEAHDALRGEGAIIGLGQAPVRFGGRARVHGARVDPGGRLVLEDTWVEP
jgi:ABC-type transport system substrate-binding protein